MTENTEQKEIHPAQVAQEFLTRTNLKGGEVEAYAKTFNWLASFLDGSLVILEKEYFESLGAQAEESPEAPAPELDAID